MIEKIFKKELNKGSERGKYFSAPGKDFFTPRRKNLIKNYVLAPDVKLIK